jgi:hypothetical protein
VKIQSSTGGSRQGEREAIGEPTRDALDVNHCISKQIVATAKGTGGGFRMEALAFRQGVVYPSLIEWPSRLPLIVRACWF